LNPERDIPADAIAVHGLTEEFLKDKPIFSEVVDDFIAFLDGAQLVIHNAEFDLKFLNHELVRIGYKGLGNHPVVDTVIMARKMFPGQPANLDALCRRFKIDNSGRTYHGALLDSQLLAEVYLELKGGRQRGLDLLAAPTAQQDKFTAEVIATHHEGRTARPIVVPPDEAEAHAKMVAALGENAIWRKYQET
jgi:DNA polymerase III subunit epsilon